LGLYLLRPPIVLGPHAVGAKDVLPGPLAPLGRRLVNLARGRSPVPLPAPVPPLPVQFIHEDDVAQAFVLCIAGAGPPGAYNIAALPAVLRPDFAALPAVLRPDFAAPTARFAPPRTAPVAPVFTSRATCASPRLAALRFRVAAAFFAAAERCAFVCAIRPPPFRRSSIAAERSQRLGASLPSRPSPSQPRRSLNRRIPAKAPADLAPYRWC